MNKVSVIIPTFKRKDLLFYEIEQLYKQKNVELEIIVINDDIPNDPADEIAKAYPDVIYIKHPTKIGPGQKRQVGFKRATSEYIATPDDDDYLIDDHFFEKAISIMEGDSHISLVSGSSIIKYEDEKDESKQYVKVPLNVKGKYNGLEYLAEMQMDYQKPLSSFPTLWRKKTLDEQDFLGQIEMSDVSLYMLACLGGDVYFLEDFVGVYRVHSRSLTLKKSSSAWINNVMRQKERVFLKIKGKISNPEKWWRFHMFCSYGFYANTSKSRYQKIKLLFWCLKHSYGYTSIYLRLLKQFVLALVFNK